MTVQQPIQAASHSLDAIDFAPDLADCGEDLCPAGSALSEGGAERKDIGVFEGIYGAAIDALESEHARSAYCLSIKSAGAQKSGIRNVREPFSLKAGKSYVVSCRVFSEKPMGFLRLSLIGKPGNNLWAVNLINDSINFHIQGGGWQDVCGIITAPDEVDEGYGFFIVNWDEADAAWLLDDLSLREIQSHSLFVHDATPRSRLAHKVSLNQKEMTAWDWESVQRDDSLLTPAILSGSKAFAEHLSTKYCLHPTLVDYLLRVELKDHDWNMKFAPPGKSFRTLAERVRIRMFEHRRHHLLIQRLIERYDLETNAFFDIGCKYGTSMTSAVELGFREAHGCDLEPKIFDDAFEIARVTRDIYDCNVKFIDSDFLKMDLPTDHYELVILINVLEHTPRLDQTIEGVANLLTSGGVAYIYQGNGRSLPIVGREPHYNIPALSLFPNDLAESLLVSQGIINEAADYCVTSWPMLDEMKNLCSDFGLDMQVLPSFDSLFFNEGKVPWGAAGSVKAKADAYLNRTLKGLKADDQARARILADEYFAEVASAQETKTEADLQRYFMASWEIVLRKQ